jgi:transposase
MAYPDHYSTKQIDHLGLVAAMYDELGIGKLINELIPQNPKKRKVSIGQAVKAMVLNGLGFANSTLYLTPHFFQNKPLDILIGEGIEAEHLNDDLLGRTLDAIYDFDPEQLYTLISLSVIKHLKLKCNFAHLDSTGFHTDGKYNNEEDVDENIIKITKGYSRDHRPDLNQIILQLICEQQAGIPIMMQTLSGNTDDKTNFKKTIKEHIVQMTTDFNVEYVVADSALYVADTLRNMQNNLWISRVPETLKLANKAIESVAPHLMENLQKSSFFSLDATYAEVKQRWLVVYSPQAYHRSIKTIDKRWLKQTDSEEKSFEKLCKQEFACEKDALKALKDFEKRQKKTEIHNQQIKSSARYKGKGRPKENQVPGFYNYQIKGNIASIIEIRTRQIERKSCFILATNQLNWQKLSHEELIKIYKEQQKVERGFRFLKDPMFMANTLFLKSPKRIMALMMVMTICLMIYAALQHKIREALKTENKTFPNQKGKLISNPTARWVLQYFTGVHLLTINHVKTVVMNLNKYHISLLKILGNQYETLYVGYG